MRKSLVLLCKRPHSFVSTMQGSTSPSFHALPNDDPDEVRTDCVAHAIRRAGGLRGAWLATSLRGLVPHTLMWLVVRPLSAGQLRVGSQQARRSRLSSGGCGQRGGPAQAAGRAATACERAAAESAQLLSNSRCVCGSPSVPVWFLPQNGCPPGAAQRPHPPYRCLARLRNQTNSSRGSCRYAPGPLPSPPRPRPPLTPMSWLRVCVVPCARRCTWPLLSQGLEDQGSSRLLDSEFDMQMAREMQQMELLLASQDEQAVLCSQ